MFDRSKDRSPGLCVSTVYRALSLLIRGGFAVRRSFGGGEAHYEPVADRPRNLYLVCLACRTAIALTEEGLREIDESIARRHEFRKVDGRLEIRGYCARCIPGNSGAGH